MYQELSLDRVIVMLIYLDVLTMAIIVLQLIIVLIMWLLGLILKN